jgi:hypothetical protein
MKPDWKLHHVGMVVIDLQKSVEHYPVSRDSCTGSCDRRTRMPVCVRIGPKDSFHPTPGDSVSVFPSRD